MATGLKTLIGLAVHALDGVVGKVQDCYFDDQTWHIRYVVVRARLWPLSWDVLLEPGGFGPPENGQLPVNLTRAQVRAGIDIDEHLPQGPVSGKKASDVLMAPLGMEAAIGMGFLPLRSVSATGPDKALDRRDPHLWSCSGVLGYEAVGPGIHSQRLEDLMLDDRQWSIVCLSLALDADRGMYRNAPIPTSMVERISWEDSCVYLRATTEELCLAHSPPIRRSEATHEVQNRGNNG